MANFDPTKDQVFGKIEIVVDPDGNAITHGPTVAQPEDKTHIRYRFSVASYNGGVTKLRRQTVYQNRNGEERVQSASSIPLAHAAVLAKLGGLLAAKASAQLAAA